MVELEERNMSRMQVQTMTIINTQKVEQNGNAIEYLLEKIKDENIQEGGDAS